MGRSGGERLSRIYAQRTTPPIAGMGRQSHAQYPRKLRAEMDGWHDAGEPRATQSEILALDGRSQEARLCGPVSLQRRSQLCKSANRHAAVEGSRRIAMRQGRSGTCIRDRTEVIRRFKR